MVFFSELFVKDGEFIKEGDTMDMTKLAKTLESIRDNPEDFYNGTLAKQIVKDIQDNKGIVTLQDMSNYEPRIRQSVQGEFGDRRWYSIPPPGSGPVIALIMNILKGKYKNNMELFVSYWYMKGFYISECVLFMYQKFICTHDHHVQCIISSRYVHARDVYLMILTRGLNSIASKTPHTIFDIPVYTTPHPLLKQKE